MRTKVRYRIALILGVIVLSLWCIYPPDEKITLGLDLKGGVQLVLRVDTDDAVRAEAGATPERIAGIREDTVRQAMAIIERRVNELGVAEPVVASYTGRDRIIVQLPGVADVEAAKQIIRSTAQLRLTLVEQGPFPNREVALRAFGDAFPDELEILPSRANDVTNAKDTFYVVRRVPAVTGTDLRTAQPSLDEFNRPAVAFTLNQDAAARFGAFTEANIGRLLATVLDGHVMSVATIIARIDAEGQIVGVSREEMVEQVVNLRTGALPADLEYVEERTVGASLGQASVRSGVIASIAGLTLVVAFMLVYYRKAGLNAFASMALNLLMLLGVMAYVPVTLTLPGIAGLILTIGMGVDSNVLIFERIKEELAAGRTARGAVGAAFDRVWTTIVDTHVASLIAAALLYLYGTSPIRGFATTLTIGLVANVFTAVFVSKTLFLLRFAYQRSPTEPLSIQWPRRRLWTTAAVGHFLPVHFTRWRWHAMALSLAVVVAGAAVMLTRGLPLGIDFSGGTMVVVEFSKPGVTEDAVRRAVAALPGDEVVQQYGATADRRFLIRSPLEPGTAGNDALEARVRQISQSLVSAGLPSFTVPNRDLVSAMIGEDLQRRGIYATLASILAITAYIGVRFRFSFAIGGIAATLHDVLVTLGCLALAGYDLTLTVTAALLTITGYSVNDTIVVFDRVRETARASPRESLETIVNLSVNQTLSRTIITAGTTFLAALALFLFGGEPLEGFAFTMLIGIVSGTYSTIFIASSIAIVLGKRTTRAGQKARPSASAS